MTEKKTILTREGLEKLEKELEILKSERRKDVAEKIKEARGQGDLSENAEYDAAKEEQAEIEARIVVIEKMLRNVEVIQKDDNSATISVGSTVLIDDEEFGKVSYTIVGSAEADPMQGKISNESLLGIALIGQKEGESVTVDSLDGAINYKILKVN